MDLEFDRWCRRVMELVRFSPDRKAIARELTGHYEDHKQSLLDLSYNEELAAQRSLEAMGDAQEIGTALNKSHKYWLGILWQVSKYLVLAALAVLLVGLWQSRDRVESPLLRTQSQLAWEAPPETAVHTRAYNADIYWDLLIPRFGKMYLTGDFTDVASATAQVTVQKTTVWQDYTTRGQTDLQLGERAVYTYNCVLENDQVLSFCYTDTDPAKRWPVPARLYDAVNNWYHLYFTNVPEDMQVGLGSVSLDWDIPVDVTLYDADGQVPDTLHLTASSLDISWDF